MDNESSLVNDVFGVPDSHADTADSDYSSDAACLCV